MNRLAAAFGLALGLAATQAAAAQIEFRGGFCLTAVNAACTAEGWGTGCFSTLRYNPRNLGDNGPRTRVSFFDTFFAENYTLQSGNLIGTTFRAVDGTAVGRGGSTFQAQMRITKQTPTAAQLTAASDFVSITGQIRDFDGIAGCDIDFQASGVNPQ